MLLLLPAVCVLNEFEIAFLFHTVLVNAGTTFISVLADSIRIASYFTDTNLIIKD